jgi:hypothetical protein
VFPTNPLNVTPASTPGSAQPGKGFIVSIEHFTAAFNCKKFKNGARLLLLALANRASDGKPRKDGRTLEYGWSFAGVGRLMADVNASSRDTVIDNMKALVDAGAVKRSRRLSHSSLSFVDIDVLRSLAYTAEDIEEFKKKADTKVGKSTTTGRDAVEKALPLISGKSTTTDVGEIPPSDVRNIPATAGGNFPTYNPKDEPQGMNTQVVETSESESELADSDSDSSSQPQAGKSFSSISDEEDAQNSLSDPYENEYQASLPTDSDSAPPPEVYANVVHLCSLWWSTHQSPEDDVETCPISETHPWGHPRTWTPAQRREAFMKARQSDLNSEEPALDDESEAEPELEPDTDASMEEALLRDEQDMLELYLKEGLGVIEDVLTWLPQSKFWYSKITSLAKLKADFDAVFASHQKYLQKALDNGTEDGCEDFIREVFLESGGAAAESLEWERLHPIDPQDAAEEEAMDAFDDEFGVGVFQPWAEEDAAAAAEREAKGTPDVFLDPWGNADSDSASYSDTPHAREADEVDDAESEPPVYRYCDDCDSVHAGMCMPDDCFYLE